MPSFSRDIWPTGIYRLTIGQHNHLTDRHLAGKHLADRFGWQTLGRQTFDHFPFSRQKIGLQTLTDRHLACRHLGKSHLSDKHLTDKHLTNFHLVDRNLANKHLTDTILGWQLTHLFINSTDIFPIFDAATTTADWSTLNGLSVKLFSTKRRGAIWSLMSRRNLIKKQVILLRKTQPRCDVSLTLIAVFGERFLGGGPTSFRLQLKVLIL